ncbi:MAG: hypothetical protein LUH49_03560 [Cloacibacillus porcorum]|uniref:hypothetical protein n=1 Tax=Cloacibacillus porcorum TaxID=1197717 RepID=UPI0023F2248C|nr:hypothetical protein [Cloacibacillus porcorum]MCD7876040.1 hypothetical protein [Cloacibacillus porcorum]
MSDQLMETNQAKIEALEAKILELEAKLEAQVQETGEELHGGRAALIGNIKNGAERLYKDVSPLVEKYREEQDEVLRAVGAKICEHPFVSVAAAFGTGLILAKLLENRVCNGGRSHRS